MTDGDKLVERTVPLVHQQSIIETVDVGFLDPGTAKIQNRTKFSFNVTRAHDYAAGEYKVTIYDLRNDSKIGAPTNITLKGENEVIDRRSITFGGGEKKKKKKDEEKKDEEKDEASESDAESDDAATEEETEQVDLQDVDDEALETDGEVKEKPGGCGCRMAGSETSGAAFLGVLLLGSALWRRRRH